MENVLKNSPASLGNVINLKKEYYKLTNKILTTQAELAELDLINAELAELDLINSKKFDMENVLINSPANYLESVINLKKEYYDLTNKILTTQAELDLIDKEPNKYLQLRNLFSEKAMQQTIQRYNDLTKNESEIFSLKVKLKEYNLGKSIDINSLGGWKISNNNLSYLEIIIAGILFGLLSNSFILFLSSSYFKKNIIN